VESGIVDALDEPSKEVLDELRGMMREAGYQDDWRSFAISKVPAVSSMETRKQMTENDVFDYYGSTEMNLVQALEHVRITGTERVLEIGGHDDYAFLKPFQARGCTCYSANIYVRYDDEATRSMWPARFLADMHRLPFRDGAFDITLLSATSHHGDLSSLATELARITRPGGVVININEPISGLLKHAFSRHKVEHGRQDTLRDELVHEHEYSIFEYVTAFRRAGFRLEKSLFSDYYRRRLEARRTTGVRFARLAGAVSKAWTRPSFRKLATGPGLWLGQAVIGLQMNAIFRRQT
jgi:SAM-dependent methyltransferase